MTNSDRAHRGIRTVKQPPPAEISPESACSDSVCSESDCMFGAEVNEELQDTKGNSEGIPTLREIEASSTTGNEDQVYKMKSNVEANDFAPAKIEFKRVKNIPRRCLCIVTPRKRKSSRLPTGEENNQMENKEQEKPEQGNEDQNSTFISRLKRSFAKMKKPTLPIEKQTTAASPQKHDFEKIDIYYFDHGNAAYFRTTDSPPAILSEVLAQQTTHYATRFWAEIFGSLHIGVTFFLTFFLQTYRFILYSVVRAIIVGFFQMTSDYLLKPILTVFFNGLIQPFLILVYNILSSIKDMLEPVADTIFNFMKPIAMILKSIRIVSISRKTIIYRKNGETEVEETMEEV